LIFWRWTWQGLTLFLRILQRRSKDHVVLKIDFWLKMLMFLYFWKFIFFLYFLITWKYVSRDASGRTSTKREWKLFLVFLENKCHTVQATVQRHNKMKENIFNFLDFLYIFCNFDNFQIYLFFFPFVFIYNKINKRMKLFKRDKSGKRKYEGVWITWEVHEVNKVYLVEMGVQSVKRIRPKKTTPTKNIGCKISNDGGARGSKWCTKAQQTKNKAGVRDRHKWRCAK